MDCNLRAVLIIGFCLLVRVSSATAAERDAKALDEQPSVLLETQLEYEKKRLSEAQGESDLLNAELTKIQGYIVRVDAASFNESAVRANLDAFTKKFREVEASMKSGVSESLGAYQEMQEHLDKLLDSARYPWMAPPTSDSAAFISELYLRYGDKELFNWKIVDGLSALEQVNPAQNVGLMYAAITRTAPHVSSLNTETFRSAFTAAKDKNKQFLRDAQERVNSAIKERDDRVKGSNERIAKLSEELEKRKQKGEKDSILTFAIFLMIGVVVLLYLGTLRFDHTIQTLIFQQRTLVELIGMAFLLLTIIILGTGEKIERSVLGTLLGTVAGYIFGQQMRALQPRAETQQPVGAQSTAQANARSGDVNAADALKRTARTGSSLAQDAAQAQENNDRAEKEGAAAEGRR